MLPRKKKGKRARDSVSPPPALDTHKDAKAAVRDTIVAFGAGYGVLPVPIKRRIAQFLISCVDADCFWHDVPYMISEAATIEDFNRIALLVRDVSRDHVATAVEAWSAGFARMHDLYKEDPVARRTLRDHQAWLDSFTAIILKYPESKVYNSASVFAALKDFETFTSDPMAFLMASFPPTMLLHFQAFLDSVALTESATWDAFNIQNIRMLTDEDDVAVTVNAWNSRLRLGRIGSDPMILILGFCRWRDVENLHCVNRAWRSALGTVFKHAIRSGPDSCICSVSCPSEHPGIRLDVVPPIVWARLPKTQISYDERNSMFKVVVRENDSVCDLHFQNELVLTSFYQGGFSFFRSSRDSLFVEGTSNAQYFTAKNVYRIRMLRAPGWRLCSCPTPLTMYCTTNGESHF